ncbi:MAG: hypothetical protein KUG77_03235 [Nannocystaceae bacterium]|nr:hypothetical protein [Nannocystaceae bacterium]
MFDYQQPRSSMTLAEGLEEYYAVHDNVTPPQQHRPEAAALFRYHDIGHVVFGTTTDLLDEARTDTWLLFGCDVGFLGYAGYFKLPEAKAAFDSVGWKTVAREAWPITKAMWNIWRRTRSMRKPWPWKPGDTALARPLVDLREEWGIEVVTGPA